MQTLGSRIGHTSGAMYSGVPHVLCREQRTGSDIYLLQSFDANAEALAAKLTMLTDSFASSLLNPKSHIFSTGRGHSPWTIMLSSCSRSKGWCDSPSQSVPAHRVIDEQGAFELYIANQHNNSSSFVLPMRNGCATICAGIDAPA